MLLHAKFFGYCALGDASLMGGIRFMQEEWKAIPDQAVFGVEWVKKQMVNSSESKKELVNAFGSNVYCVEKGRDRVFFSAREYSVGKYQIFQFSSKDNERLAKLVNND